MNKNMTGWLIVNHFLTGAKYGEISARLLAAAAGRGIALRGYTNAGVLSMLARGAEFTEADKPDFVLFWDKDTRLARLLESYNIRLFNTAAAIEVCDDKAATYIKLRNCGIKMPRTLPVPLLFGTAEWRGSEFAAAVCEGFSFPLIVKECYGSFGEQVYLIKSEAELLGRLNASGTKPLIVQEFIAASAGRDIRINVVGGEAIACMYRYSVNGDFRANITGGGKMEAYRPSAEQTETAVRACDALGLDFGGADILFGENGEPILCEVNSNAHFKNMHDCTGVDTADYIMRHIENTVG
jgi:RimK family alpha-L-glutamate ligase